MSSLNYLRIAQLLGGTLTRTRQADFSGFSVGETALERFRLLEREDEKALLASIPRNQFPDLVRAFEKVREVKPGQRLELDRVLVDPALREELLAECRRLGVLATPKAIFRRLQGFRKYPPGGIKLKRTTLGAEIDADRFFYAAELAYTQLSYRSNVSVDDVVTDPDVGRHFDEICQTLAPSGRSMEFRWAALRLRKMRSFTAERMGQLLEITPAEIEEQLEDGGTLDRLKPESLPEDKGLFSFAERAGHPRYLYVGSGDSIRAGVSPFCNATPFRLIAGEFWIPELHKIAVSYAVVKAKWMGVTARDLGMRLICERRPVFNMPVEIGEVEAA